MAAKQCRHGKVKTGPRKGRCRKRKLTGAARKRKAPRKAAKRKAPAKRRKACRNAHCPPGYEVTKFSQKTGKRLKRKQCASTKTGKLRPMVCGSSVKVSKTIRVARQREMYCPAGKVPTKFNQKTGKQYKKARCLSPTGRGKATPMKHRWAN